MLTKPTTPFPFAALTKPRAAFLCAFALVACGGQDLTAIEVSPQASAHSAALTYATLPTPVLHLDPDLCQSGTTLCDAAGRSGLRAVPQGAAQLGAGVRGSRGLTFNGGADAYQVPDHPLLHLRSTLTIAVWVNPVTVAGTQTLVNKWYSMDSYMVALFDGRYDFALAFPGGSWGVTSDVGAPALPGVWTHVAVVYDGGQQRLYINGVRAATKALGGLLQDSTRPLMIGNHPSWNAFRGQLDDIRVYDVALNDDQIVSVAAGRR